MGTLVFRQAAVESGANPEDVGAAARDGAAPRTVAVKVIRNNDTMRRAAAKELQLLERIAAADPDNKRYCIRLLSSFQHRNHLCLVFEALALNLRQVLKKFGGGGGINVAGVRRFSWQLFTALRHLRACGIVHADLKLVTPPPPTPDSTPSSKSGGASI